MSSYLVFTVLAVPNEFFATVVVSNDFVGIE
jgi:hypothetical protein